MLSWKCLPTSSSSTRRRRRLSGLAAAEPVGGIAPPSSSDKLSEHDYALRDVSSPQPDGLNTSKVSAFKTWEEYVQKGKDLSCYFAKDATPPSSPWTSHDELARNGWTSQVKERKISPTLQPAYDGLGLSTDPKLNIFAAIDQDKPYQANGQEQVREAAAASTNG